MKTSKELMKKANIIPKLKLAIQLPKGGVKTTGPHRVKVLKDKVIDGIDDKGNKCQYVAYLLEENGEKKQYKTRMNNKDTGELSYLVQNLADVEEGEEVILECKKQGIKNYIFVDRINPGAKHEELSDDPDQPDQPDMEMIDAE